MFLGAKVSSVTVLGVAAVAISFIGFLGGMAVARAAELCPKYGECVPAEQFSCQRVDSSLVTQVCFNEPTGYMVIRLKQTDYHYCDVEPSIVAGLVTAPSAGRYY